MGEGKLRSTGPLPWPEILTCGTFQSYSREEPERGVLRRVGSRSRAGAACGTSELQLIPLIALTDTVAARPLPVCRVMQNSHTWTDEPNFVLQHPRLRAGHVATDRSEMREVYSVSTATRRAWSQGCGIHCALAPEQSFEAKGKLFAALCAAYSTASSVHTYWKRESRGCAVPPSHREFAAASRDATIASTSPNL